MSKKWMKVDPTTLKVGDEVRWVMAITGGRVIREVAVSEIAAHGIRLGMTWAAQAQGTWYVRKSKKANPGKVIKVTRKSLRNRQKEIYKSLGMSQMHFALLVAGEDPLSDEQWKAKQELENISFLLGEEEPTPPTRPDEPPVGSFFRVDRTGELYLRMHEGNGDYGYVSLLGDREGDLCTWTDITDHGDTITRLLLVEATDD